MFHNIGVKLKRTLNTKFSEVPPTHNIVAKGDSAASKNYWREEDVHCLSNLQNFSGPPVTLPDGDKIKPSQKGTINLSNNLSLQAQEATVLKNLTSSSLISLGQICDDNCTIILNKKNLVAIKSKNINTTYRKKDILLQGERNLQDGLWDIPIQKRKLDTNNFISPPLHGLQAQCNRPNFKNLALAMTHGTPGVQRQNILSQPPPLPRRMESGENDAKRKTDTSLSLLGTSTRPSS